MAVRGHIAASSGWWLVAFLRLQLSLRPVTTMMPDFDLPLTLTTHLPMRSPAHAVGVVCLVDAPGLVLLR